LKNFLNKPGNQARFAGAGQSFPVEQPCDPRPQAAFCRPIRRGLCLARIINEAMRGLDIFTFACQNNDVVLPGGFPRSELPDFRPDLKAVKPGAGKQGRIPRALLNQTGVFMVLPGNILLRRR
jgi:hypothetical protein